MDGSPIAGLRRAVVQADGSVLAEAASAGPGTFQSMEIPADGWVGSELQLAVRFENVRGVLSEPSNEVMLSVVEVPGPGAAPRLLVDENRVLVEWDEPAQGAAITDGYHLFRSGVQLTGEPIALTRFEDRDYTEGEEYVWVVAPLRRVGADWIRGIPYAPAVATALDRTPPMPPSEIVVTATAAGAFIQWAPSPEADLARYRVYRRDAQEDDFHRIDPGNQTTTVLFDPGHGPGQQYAVTAVDRAGNESAPSAPVPGTEEPGIR